MTENTERDGKSLSKRMAREIAAKEERKLKARAEKNRGVWFGLGMFGLVGWSVAIPMLICVSIGVWIDSKWPGRFSWTLLLLFIGVILGCFNAWHWVRRESRHE